MIEFLIIIPHCVFPELFFAHIDALRMRYGAGVWDVAQREIPTGFPIAFLLTHLELTDLK